MNRVAPFWARWRVKRLEREMGDLLRELDCVYSQLEIAYRESEAASGIPYIPHAEPDEFDAEQGPSNVVRFPR